MTVTALDLLCGTDWGPLLRPEFEESYWVKLRAFVEDERSHHDVYPSRAEVFAALHLTPCAQTKVVIVGQDPYPAAGQANGLAFAVPCGVRVPASLANIHRELRADMGVPPPGHGSLLPWARRGVLLLNTTLTVRARKSGSHRGAGWERFTDAVVRVVAEKSGPVFILWGRYAQRKKAVLGATPPQMIIESSHPSPRSAHRGFLGSRPFSRANVALMATGREEVDWGLGE